MTTAVTSVVFDIGNVLIEWDPQHLYRRLIPDEAARRRFLAEVCTSDWNLEQDRGRSWPDALAERIALFPEHEALIQAYDSHWNEMVPRAIAGSVAILEELDTAGVPLFAITNFSHKYDTAAERFPFFSRFRGVVVSAREGLVKPDPAIYRLLLDRHGLTAAGSVFIDDSPRNVAAAEAVGMRALLFTAPDRLRRDLRSLGLPLSAKDD